MEDIIFVDPLLQDCILLPDDFAEYICHIGNAYEMHSIVQSGLIPGGKSNRKDRESVFFTAVNPRWKLNQIKEKVNTVWINPESHRTNTLGDLITIQYLGAVWVLLRESDCDSLKLDRMQLLFQTHYQRFVSKKWLRENKGKLQVTQVTSRNTCAELATPSEGSTCFRIEKIRWPWEWSSSAQGDLWQWTSWNKSKRKSSTITWAIRKSPKQEHVAEGLDKSEEINHFSQESKDLITEMRNNEIFEFCEISSKRQRPDCA